MALTRVLGKVLDTSVGNISELPLSGYDGQAMVVNHFYSNVEGGGGTFIWDGTASNKSTHNGGTIIDPDVAQAQHTGTAITASYFTAGTGTGTGVWKRYYDSAVNVKWFGANGNGVSGTNTVVLDNIINSGFTSLFIPNGTYFLESELSISAGVSIQGEDNFGTVITGDGDLLELTADPRDHHISNLSIKNSTTRGKLFTLNSGGWAGPLRFKDIRFGTSTHHIHTETSGIVGWAFEDCEFKDASVVSKNIVGLGMWATSEIRCYSWYNTTGLVLKGNSFNNSMIDCVYELNTGHAIELIGDNVNNEIGGFNFTSCHFEGNASDGVTTEQIIAETTAATRIRSLNFNNCLFTPADLTHYTQNVKFTAGAGGNILQIAFNNGVVLKDYPLTNDFACSITNMYLQFGAAAVLQANNSSFVTSNHTFAADERVRTYAYPGVNDGSDTLQATHTISSYDNFLKVYVTGNYYDATPGSNNAYLEAIVNINTGDVTILEDIDNATGTNQGFVIAFDGTYITVSNKSSLSVNQSGTVIVTAM